MVTVRPFWVPDRSMPREPATLVPVTSRLAMVSVASPPARLRPVPPPRPVTSTWLVVMVAPVVPDRSKPSLDAPAPRPSIVVEPVKLNVPPPVMTTASSPVFVAVRLATLMMPPLLSKDSASPVTLEMLIVDSRVVPVLLAMEMPLVPPSMVMFDRVAASLFRKMEVPVMPLKVRPLSEALVAPVMLTPSVAFWIDRFDSVTSETLLPPITVAPPCRVSPRTTTSSASVTVVMPGSPSMVPAVPDVRKLVVRPLDSRTATLSPPPSSSWPDCMVMPVVVTVPSSPSTTTMPSVPALVMAAERLVGSMKLPVPPPVRSA